MLVAAQEIQFSETKDGGKIPVKLHRTGVSNVGVVG